MSKEWPKSLSVDKRIIGTLSRSTYDNFPQALKELVVNSYDADARKVEIKIDLKREIITILDDGKGMSEQDFGFYLRIAGKSRKKTQYTDKGRRIVGKFGVGFLAVFPFCKTYKIETTPLGSEELVNASIDCEKYFNFDEEIPSGVESVPIHGGTTTKGARRTESFTKIRLVGFTNELHAFFAGEYKSTKKSSITSYEPMKLVEWTLSEYLPIKYRNDKRNKIFGLESRLPFDVFLNDKTLFRNNNLGQILETHNGDFESIGNINFRYAIGTQFGTVQPSESRYILLRNFNVGVGTRETFGIGLDGRLYSKLAWLSIDVDILEGLNDLISVSRDKFNFSPDYEKFKEFFRAKLRYWSDTILEVSEYSKLVDDSSENQIIKFDTEVKKDAEKIEKSLSKKGIDIEVASVQFDLEKYRKKKLTKSEKFVVEKKAENDRSTEAKEENSTKIIINKISDQYAGDKKLRIGNDLFSIKYDEWRPTAEYPVCMFEKNVLIVNRSHELLRNKKTRDALIKFFSIIATNYNRGVLNRDQAVKLNNQIIQTFQNQQ